MIGDLVVPHLCRPLARQPGLKVIVPVDDDDGEVGEEDEDVGDDVADDEEGPGVESTQGERRFEEMYFISDRNILNIEYKLYNILMS